MKILIAATQFYPEFGGIESSIYHIAKTLKKNNHESVILTGKTRPDLPLRDEVEGVAVIRYQFAKVGNIFKILQPLLEKWAIDKSLSKLLKNEVFDVIWARHPSFICSAEKAGFKGELIYIPAMVKSIFEENEISYLKGNFLKKITASAVIRSTSFIIEHFEKKAIKNASKIIVFSNVVKKMFCDYYKVSDEKFRIITPGIDAEKFKPRPASTDLLQKLGVEGEKTVFIYVGRVTYGKKVDLLLEAFSLIRDERAFLIIVGGGNELSSFRALTARMGISQRVHFADYQTDTSSYYNVADFFVMPSDLEGFGHVYLEAMASGVPCIAFRTDYPRVRVATEDIIIDGKNGFLADGVSTSSLVKKMELALTLSPDDYKAMSEYSRKYCVEEYSWNKFVNSALYN